MSLLRRFTLRSRFHLVIAVVTASLLALGAWGVATNRAGTEKVAAMFDQAQAGAAQVAKLRESLGEVRRLEASLIAVGTSRPSEKTRRLEWASSLCLA